MPTLPTLTIWDAADGGTNPGPFTTNLVYKAGQEQGGPQGCEDRQKIEPSSRACEGGVGGDWSAIVRGPENVGEGIAGSAGHSGFQGEALSAPSVETPR